MFNTMLHTATLVLSLVGLHLYNMLPKPSTLEKIGYYYLVLNLVQVLVHFCMETFFTTTILYCVPPFPLLYGPIAYFVFTAFLTGKLGRRTVYFHVLPFMVMVLLYIVLLLDFDLQQAMAKVYYILLSGLIGISWCVYPIYILARGTEGNTLSVRLYRVGMGILALLTLVMVPLVLEKSINKMPENPYMFNWITLTAMFIGAVLAYIYFFKQLSSAVFPYTDSSDAVKIVTSSTSEALPVVKEMSAIHKQLIQQYLDKRKRFLDPNFHLDDMVHDLGLAKSTISQFFQQVYGDGFLKTVNSWRVDYACLLLQDEHLNGTMEELAIKCGFNSRASFYRNFSKELQCSPIEFRERMLNNVK